MAYYGSTHVDNFEIDCSSGTPYVAWEEDCGYDPPQSPLLPAENPRIACGAPFGDHGWFSSTNNLATFVANQSAVILWNGTEIWDGVSYLGNTQGWFSPDGNTSSNAGTYYVIDQSTIVTNANGGRQYYGHLYKRSGSFVQVGAITSGRGYRPDSCGDNPNSPSDVYVSCVKRTSYYHGCPTPGGGNQVIGGQNPSSTCGAPYGDGWFDIGTTSTIIVVEGQDVYKGAYITTSEITIGDYRYIKSGDPQSGFTIYTGMDINVCGHIPYPGGSGGTGRGVYKVPIN